MSATLEQQVRQLQDQVRLLQDRAEILDCVQRYSRGLDRHDEEVLASAYHPDATEVHGHHFVGPIPEFVKWVNGLHESCWAAHQHFLSNHRVDIDGDVAHAETYVLHVLRWRDKPAVDIGGSRYIDRLERRDGKWAIVLRQVRVEWYAQADASAYPAVAELYPSGTWDKSDLSYARPLLGPGATEDHRDGRPSVVR